ncbi:MAG: hypothetical protein QOI13_3416, partial [Paraburkholderia sp.]|nr:hypothetical protein [Paraburkholderia sp.]
MTNLFKYITASKWHPKIVHIHVTSRPAIRSPCHLYDMIFGNRYRKGGRKNIVMSRSG